MKRVIPFLVAAVCVAGVIWAVSFDTLPPADFTFCNGTEIKTVDPAIVTGSPEGRIINGLFEGLVRWHPKTLEPIEGVARRWEISPDGLTYTFYIRNDARWSDGTPVTADDFVFSWRRFLHPKTAAEYAYELWYVVGAEKYSSGQVKLDDPVEIELKQKEPGALPHGWGIIRRGKLVGIEETGDKQNPNRAYIVEIDGRRRRFMKHPANAEAEDYRWLTYDFEEVGIHAPDERTLVVRLKHPVPYFLKLMGFYPMFPVNRKCVETHGFPAWTKPENIVGNGAFRLEFRRVRDRIRMVKSWTYWNRDKVRLGVVDALAVKSATTMLNLYMTGQADWITTVPDEIVPRLLERPQGDFKPVPFLATYYYTINTTKPPLDDVRVRRALALAMNRKEIVEKVKRAGQTPAWSFVPDEMARKIAYTPARCKHHCLPQDEDGRKKDDRKKNVQEARRLLGYLNSFLKDKGIDGDVEFAV